MKDHLTKDEVEKYSKKLLQPAELIQVDKHLSQCETCRKEVLPKSMQVFSSLHREFSLDAEEERHLSFDEVADYVEGKTDLDRNKIAAHLELCSRCAAEVNDLKAFRKEILPQGRERWFPSISQFLAIAAVLALFVWVSTLLYRNQTKKLNDQLQQANSRIDQPEKEKDRLIAERSESSETVLLALRDAGGRIIVDRQGNLKGLESASNAEQKMILAALQNEDINISPLLNDLITKSGVVLGEKEKPGLPFALHRPVGTVVEENTPMFEWETLSGAQKYRVTVLDRSMSVAADSGWISATSWKTSAPFRRGERYVWQVKALKNGKEVVSPQAPAGEARFQVLDQGAFERLEQARNRHPDSHLLLGLLATEYGMLDDAEHHLNALSANNPDSKEVSGLLQKIQRLRSYKGDESPTTTKPAQ